MSGASGEGGGDSLAVNLHILIPKDRQEELAVGFTCWGHECKIFPPTCAQAFRRTVPVHRHDGESGLLCCFVELSDCGLSAAVDVEQKGYSRKRQFKDK